MLRILIADDHSIMRKGLKDLLRDEYPTAHIEDVSDSEELVKKAMSGDWSVIISDMTMPGRSAFDAIKQIKQEYPAIPILVLSMHPEENYAIRLLKAGASGYLNKGEAPTELVKAVQRLLLGRKFISSSIAEKLAEGLYDDGNRPLHDLLSDREFDVFKLISSGKTPTDIADQLFLSITTISTYRSRILQKMKMKSNADLTRYALDNNLID
jgi:DNA-binding NarL/FixJ family response regulator